MPRVSEGGQEKLVIVDLRPNWKTPAFSFSFDFYFLFKCEIILHVISLL